MASIFRICILSASASPSASASTTSVVRMLNIEIAIHRECKYQFVVHLSDVLCYDKKMPLMVLVMYPSDLGHVITVHGKMPECQTRAMLLQIVIAMCYLSTLHVGEEGEGIIHNDLKISNILIDSDENIKFTKKKLISLAYF
jgi:serine/threonine protein kinase